MTRSFTATLALWTVAGLWLATDGVLRADDSADTRQEIQLLKERNAALEKLVGQQQSVIDGLNRRVGDIEQANAKRNETGDTAPGANDSASVKSPGGFNLGKINFSGEGGVAFFNTGREGMYANSEFRVDEAKLFVESPVWDETYFFCEINLATRENNDLNVKLGELYLDFENVSKLWGHDRQLNVRAGRFDVPFGEEYQLRDAILNPLISHSLVDFWGVDEGVELYGSFGKFSYTVAVQNGGESGTQDFNDDKAVVGRVAYDPVPWLHLSVSAMRTGDLDAANEAWSELWFANAWLASSLGGSDTTTYHANLVEGDVAVRWERGHLKAFGGYIQYDDNDSAGNNRRELYYYSVEAMHSFSRKFYAAARFSQIFVNNGYPLVGYGDFDEYFYNELTKELWRLSLGLGYRFSDHLVLKAEYTFERGKELDGTPRDQEDFFGVEAAFKF